MQIISIARIPILSLLPNNVNIINKKQLFRGLITNYYFYHSTKKTTPDHYNQYKSNS